MSSSTPTFGGAFIPWYRRDEYPRMIEILGKNSRLPATFDQWKTRADIAFREATTMGATYRAYVNPQKFAAWCVIRGRDIDHHALQDFVGDTRNWTEEGPH